MEQALPFLELERNKKKQLVRPGKSKFDEGFPLETDSMKYPYMYNIRISWLI